MDRKKIEFLKETYPKGTRIQLNRMDDPYHPVPPGTLGTVEHVDDAGTIHMNWDNGQSLGIVSGEDSFIVIDRPSDYEEVIKVLVVRPKEKPIVEYVRNTLEAQQKLVGGVIEEVGISNDAVLVCNEEGKLYNMQANRRVGDDIIAGTFFIARDDGSEYLCSLSDEQIEKYMKEFNEIEQIEQEEMIAKADFIIRGF